MVTCLRKYLVADRIEFIVTYLCNSKCSRRLRFHFQLEDSSILRTIPFLHVSLNSLQDLLSLLTSGNKFNVSRPWFFVPILRLQQNNQVNVVGPLLFRQKATADVDIGDRKRLLQFSQEDSSVFPHDFPVLRLARAASDSRQAMQCFK